MVTETLYDPSGGILCLDFANSADRPGGGRSTERLHDYRDFLIFCEQGGCLPPARARRLERLARANPAAAQEVLARAREFREAVHRTLAAPLSGRKPAKRDLDIINAEIGRALGNSRLETAEGAYRFGWRDDDELDRPLWAIVRSTAELLTSPEREHIRMCASESCEWLFLDRSKNQARRWCDMRSCGNRAKAKKHRARQGP